MAVQAPTRAGRGNCARGHTIPRHARTKGEGAQAGRGWRSPSRGDCRRRKGGRAVPPATLACAQTGGRAGGTACERKVGAVPSARKEGEAHCPPCASGMRAKAWRVCGGGGVRKLGVGGGATRAEGTVREWKGGGWRTVHAAPPPSAQRGGGHVGEVRCVNGERMWHTPGGEDCLQTERRGRGALSLLRLGKRAKGKAGGRGR